MSRSVRLGAWLVPTLVVFSFMSMSPVAAASCAEPVPLAQALAEAPVTFVGTVTALEHDGRIATFAVEEVWKGDVGAIAVVSGGPNPSELDRAGEDGLTVVTSVDRTYILEETYLVVSHGAEGEFLLDNACSATQVYTAELAEFRPDTAYIPPIDEPTAGSGATWLWWVVASLGAGAAAGLGTAALRRSRRRGASDPVVT